MHHLECLCVCDRERVSAHMLRRVVVPVCTRRYMRVCTRVCNQSRFGTLQEVINSQDYCADTMISKVLHNSLCGKGWLNQSTWKGERDVRFAASCRGPSASLSAPAVSLLCEEEGVWTSKSSHATLETETISKGSGERWHRGESPFHDPQKVYPCNAGKQGHCISQRHCVLITYFGKAKVFLEYPGQQSWNAACIIVWRNFFSHPTLCIFILHHVTMQAHQLSN